MRCSICKKNDAVIFIRRKGYCKECFIRIYERRVERLVKRFKLVEKGDRVMVAVSGGKDSLSAALILNKLKDKIGFEVELLFIDLGIPTFSNVSKKSVEKFAKMAGLELHTIILKDYVGKSLVELKRGSRPMCAVCGIVKRYIMNKYPKEHGFNKVATGHNADDMVEFFFTNWLSGNFEWISKLKPIIPSTHPKLLAKVRPLFECTEEENRAYAKLNELPIVQAKCPFKPSHKWKKIVNEIERKVPNFKLNFVKSLERFPEIEYESVLRECKICGEPSSSEVCSFCKVVGRAN
ncbi:MAG: adenine nucleotide alpha hydrolase family protein [Candidatus Aenigmarchaeota archaeon]|nr:adenine nucleotide alpha hydrolase family protein [Candidatus Aenigmarchaeota archaeon]